jgi:hypothetical protein
MTVHIMTDIETLSTRPGAIILSAAFVRFSDEAHMTINLSVPDQKMLGMEEDESTLAWWRDKQDAWARATSDPRPLAIALPYITQWLDWARAGDDMQIWCHGATFDCPLMQELFRRAGIPCPWQFWAVRDTRTLYDLALINPKDYAVPPPHVALNDAIGQTRAANAALAILARAHVSRAVA